MPRYRELLGLVLLVTAANYARFAVGPFQETLRAALTLTDNQVALLQGPALAVPTVLAAIPVGVLIDRHSRVVLLFWLTALTLLGSALTALAFDFAPLIIARCVVGLAAAATTTAAFSLLADIYAPAERGRANMLIAVGQVTGASVTYAVGGKLLTIVGAGAWHQAMLMMLSPLGAVLFVPLAMREPARVGGMLERPAAREVCASLWGYRGVLLPLLAGVMMVSIAECAALIWAAPAFTRSYGLSPAQTGAIMATALLVSGLSGALAGGVLSDRCQRAGGPARTMAVLGKLLLLSIPSACFGIMPGATSASLLLVVFMTVGSVIGLAATTLATVVIPGEVRGLFLAVLFATGTIFGIGLAPVAVSLLAAVLGGPRMIGKALTLICITSSLLGTATFMLGKRALRVNTGG